VTDKRKKYEWNIKDNEELNYVYIPATSQLQWCRVFHLRREWQLQSSLGFCCSPGHGAWCCQGIYRAPFWLQYRPCHVWSDLHIQVCCVLILTRLQGSRSSWSFFCLPVHHLLPRILPSHRSIAVCSIPNSSSLSLIILYIFDKLKYIILTKPSLETWTYIKINY